MVKICPNTYPKQREEKYRSHFEKYPYELSSFQKYAIEAIVENDHILITAHTGSGKTLPAEFAIEFFVSQGKKVIYTAPIKALSNQKFHEFTQKYPHISFGILTGDIKTNPEADVLIMTTEILQNTLYRKRQQALSQQFQLQSPSISPSVSSISPAPASSASLLMFEMNFETELACVIFDEVHYINDPERGKVWEETIMILPQHIQMVMLSATLDAPEKFALWCEERGVGSPTPPEGQTKKQVYLTTTYERVVPLTHYSFITTNSSIFKKIKDKAVQEEIKSMIHQPMVLQSAKGEFNEVNYQKMKKMLALFSKNDVSVKKSQVLNQVLKYMVEKEMLPALCFVLSRKLLETLSNEITTNLLEFDSKVPYVVRYECEQIIRKLPNYQEYLELPEYLQMVKLLEKGIAIHHAGVMPILREMVELLYAKGFIKLLLVTETFSVGINLPTKAVLFTDIIKFDGSNERVLYAHEYTQMAGRAGRRGIDTVGHVIHLNNIFREVDTVSYRTMLKGKPQTLTSKFKISYSLLLNLISMGETDFLGFVGKSMIQENQTNQLREIYAQLTAQESDLQRIQEGSIEHMRTPLEVVREYLDCLQLQKTSINKKRREIDKKIQEITDNHRHIQSDKETVTKYLAKKEEHDRLQREYRAVEKNLEFNLLQVMEILKKHGYIDYEDVGDDNENDTNQTSEKKQRVLLTEKGKIAVHLREVHCLAISQLFHKVKTLTAQQMVSVFSCFTNITVPEDRKANRPQTQDTEVSSLLVEVATLYHLYEDEEVRYQINTGTDQTIHYELIGYVEEWCKSTTAEDCKYLLQRLAREKEIFLGEFVKALLKINNISAEMEKIAELTANVEWLSRLREIPELTLKYVVTNQSLYV